VISVNLLPKEERSEERQLVTAPRKNFLLPLAAIVAVVVPLTALHLMQASRIQGLRSDLVVAEQESQRLKPQIDRINQLMRKREELNLRLNLVRDLNRERTLQVQLLDELSIQVPEHLWLTKLRQTGPRAYTLEGVTFSNLVVADLMSRLEATDLYGQIDLAVAERKKIDSEPVMTFTLTTRVTK
jgi:type IV pilus assembly protein PilN